MAWFHWFGGRIKSHTVLDITLGVRSEVSRTALETMTRATDQVPWMMKPMKRKMSSTLPASYRAGKTKGVSGKTSTHAEGTTHLEVDLAVGLADVGQASKNVLLLAQAVAQHHEEATNDGEVAEEEVDVKDQPVAEPLHDDDAQERAHGDLGIAAHDDGNGRSQHDLLRMSVRTNVSPGAPLFPSLLTTTLVKRKMWLMPHGKWQCFWR